MNEPRSVDPPHRFGPGQPLRELVGERLSGLIEQFGQSSGGDNLRRDQREREFLGLGDEDLKQPTAGPSARQCHDDGIG